ncbi:MAG: hypothetical protein V4561_09990 [Bacteroidota bacterium]
MRTKGLLTIFCTLFLFQQSCNRKEKDENAGKGGNATLNIVMKHHNESKNILNGKVYIKYNAQDAPSAFDDSVNCVSVGGVSTGTFNSLKKGKYYLYGTGYDTSVSQAVKGGLPYTVNEEVNLNITLPVTEAH